MLPALWGSMATHTAAALPQRLQRIGGNADSCMTAAPLYRSKRMGAIICTTPRKPCKNHDIFSLLEVYSCVVCMVMVCPDLTLNWTLGILNEQQIKGIA